MRTPDVDPAAPQTSEAHSGNALANAPRAVGSAHSPGPWRYERRDGDRYIYAADGESLQCDMDYYPWVSANEADWPLIAAAPELLEALRNLREAGNTLRLAEQDGINVHGAMSAYIGARDMADVVIAKATGEQ